VRLVIHVTAANDTTVVETCSDDIIQILWPARDHLLLSVTNPDTGEHRMREFTHVTDFQIVRLRI
jgi:hypothetical protein